MPLDTTQKYKMNCGRRSAGIIVWLAGLLLVGCANSPPVQEMSDARQAIAAAEEADAQTLAPVPLSEARRLLAEAEEQLRQEAYGLARVNAVRAKNRAVHALEASQVEPPPSDD
jgi:hypothetical protein